MSQISRSIHASSPSTRPNRSWSCASTPLSSRPRVHGYHTSPYQCTPPVRCTPPPGAGVCTPLVGLPPPWSSNLYPPVYCTPVFWADLAKNTPKNRACGAARSAYNSLAQKVYIYVLGRHPAGCTHDPPHETLIDCPSSRNTGKTRKGTFSSPVGPAVP